MAAGDVATVFLEMSLGTRLAVSFPASSTTVADLKRIVSHEHAACFPRLGQIAVQSIKVEQGGSRFHLADSMAVRDAFRFHGINELWHLQVDASLQVDQGMVTQTQGHSGGVNSANHSAPAPGRGHEYEGSWSRRRSNSEMLPADQVEAEAEDKDSEQGTCKKRLRSRTHVGNTPIELSSDSSSSSSSESEEMDINTVHAPMPIRYAPTPQFVVELKKCHFVEKNGQYLNVPQAFSRAHGYAGRKKVLLRMGGESWTVNLKHGHNRSCGPRTSLRYGWHQFCVDNRLRVGETCFFRALPGEDGGGHHVLKVEVRRLDGSYAT